MGIPTPTIYHSRISIPSLLLEVYIISDWYDGEHKEKVCLAIIEGLKAEITEKQYNDFLLLEGEWKCF